MDHEQINKDIKFHSTKDLDRYILMLKRLQNKDLADCEVGKRRGVNGIILGYMLGMNTQLPSTPVHNPTNYFLEVYGANLDAVTNQINAAVCIDVAKASEVARNVYQFRYNMVHNTEISAKLIPLVYSGSVATLPSAVKGLLEQVGLETLTKASEYYF